MNGNDDYVELKTALLFMFGFVMGLFFTALAFVPLLIYRKLTMYLFNKIL